MEKKIWSLPSRERGLKSYEYRKTIKGSDVAPLAGAWIEIRQTPAYLDTTSESLPSRERGLK